MSSLVADMSSDEKQASNSAIEIPPVSSRSALTAQAPIPELATGGSCKLFKAIAFVHAAVAILSKNELADEYAT